VDKLPPGARGTKLKLLSSLKLSNSRKSAIYWPESRMRAERTGRARTDFGVKR